MEVGFRDRAEGTESKLRTYHDGFRILGIFGQLLFHERPLLVTGLLSGLFFLLGLGLGLPVVVEFASTGLVPRFPTALLAASLVLLAGVFLLMGVLLQGQAKIRRETARLFYLQFPAPTTGSTGTVPHHDSPRKGAV